MRKSRDQAEGVARDLASAIRSTPPPSAATSPTTRWRRSSPTCTKRFGRLDILINDAAYNKSIPFPDLDNLTIEEWDKIIAVNLTGPMRHQGGGAGDEGAGSRPRRQHRVGRGPGPTGSSIAYAVSKAGLIHLTRCMAVAMAPETLVNCVAPGLLEGTRATSNLRPEQVERSAVGVAAQDAPPTRTTAPIRSSPCAAPRP